MVKATLTINGVTRPYNQWVGLINPNTGKPAIRQKIQDCLRRRKRGEYLTDVQCLWGKLDAPEESQLLQNSLGSYQLFKHEVSEAIEQIFTKHFGEMAKVHDTRQTSKARVITYNPYWSKLPKKVDVAQLTEEEMSALGALDSFHFFCFNEEDLINLHSLTQYHFEGGYEYLYDLLNSKPIIKCFDLKNMSSFRTWNSLVQLTRLCEDINVMAINKDKVISLALQLGLNPAILPNIQCSQEDFPTPEQAEWWDILGDDIKLYPVQPQDLIN